MLASKQFKVTVNTGKLSQVVDIVLVGLDIESKIHSSQFVKFTHVNIVTEVVTSKVRVLLAMLFHTAEELVKLVLSLKDINFLRFDFFGFGLFNGWNGSLSILSEVS